MRKALIIMIAMFISLNVAAIAEEPTKDVNYETVLSKTSSNNRPRTLIPDTIECCYSYGVLYFNSDIEMTNLRVIVIHQDENSSYTYYLNSSSDCIFTQLALGDYYIAVYDDSSTYEGLLTIY